VSAARWGVRSWTVKHALNCQLTVKFKAVLVAFNFCPFPPCWQLCACKAHLGTFSLKKFYLHPNLLQIKKALVAAGFELEEAVDLAIGADVPW